MKLYTVLIFFTGIFLSSVNQNEQVVGKWNMCISENNGVLQRTNHCPNINFTKEGTGTVENIGNFKWEIKNNYIFFTFPSVKDRQMFISSDTEFEFEIYKENNLEYFKLSNKKSESWCLLARTSK